MSIIYHVGDDSPDFRILKITIPPGWSVPDTDEKKEGYFTVKARDGKIVSQKTEGMSIILEVYGLKQGRGEVVVKYGDKSEGGPGARASLGAGNDTFRIETDSGSSQETGEIEVSPQVEKN